MIDEIVSIAARDGTTLAARIYRPDGSGPYPALFGASPYRFDNNKLPASPQFLWRETGPIEWYVEQGYAYVNMDLRGCGRSGGEFEFLGKNEQTDLYDVIEWIGAQDWCTGKVGGIGQSYFCMVQWFMGALAPPSLACLAAHDGLADVYRASTHHGGIPCDFFPGYWWFQNRMINRVPAEGPSREQLTDLAGLVAAHPTYDDFWRERSAWEGLSKIKVPLYSSGAWGKIQLHTRGNIDGYLPRAGAEEAAHVGRAQCLGGGAGILQRRIPPEDDAAVLRSLSEGQADRLHLAAERRIRRAQQRHRAQRRNLAAAGRAIYPLVSQRRARAAASPRSTTAGWRLQKPGGGGATSYDYPNPGWIAGVAGFGPTGPAGGFDPVRRVLTFTSAPLAKDMEITGPIKLTLYASSSARDTDFFIKLMDQYPQAPEDRGKGLNPFADVITRGWLRASHRALDPERSTEMVPYQTHSDPQPLTPGEIYKFEISLEPMAYLIKAGHRLRLEIVNGNSPMSEALWVHYYTPNKVGRDTIYHDARSILRS